MNGPRLPPGAERRSNGPAAWRSIHLAPRLREVLNQTSVSSRALPGVKWRTSNQSTPTVASPATASDATVGRSEEHTSELQSQSNLVCRLLLEKKKTNNNKPQ